MGITKPQRMKRTHSKVFKAELVKACLEPGASVSGIAMANGVHPNLLSKWLRISTTREAGVGVRAVRAASPEMIGGFVPVSIEPPREGIRIEARRGDAVVKVEWPVSAAGACAAWLRDWLK